MNFIEFPVAGPARKLPSVSGSSLHRYFTTSSKDPLAGFTEPPSVELAEAVKLYSSVELLPNK